MTLFTIAGRELRALFLSPLAWTILGVLQFITAYLFLAQLDQYLLVQPRLAGIENAPGVTDLVAAPLLGNVAVLLLLITPLLSMRLLAEEQRSGTLSLLLAAPVSMTQIVLGKYLGLLGFLGVLLLMIALMPLSLLAGGSLDLGKLAAGLLGLGLALAAFAAAGLYMSSLTAQPTVAAVSSFGLLLLVWIIDWAGKSRDDASALFGWLSLLRHYENLLKGLINSVDLVYYGLFIVTFLVLTLRRLDAKRIG